MIDLEPIARALCKSRIISDCDDACENKCQASSSALASSGRDVQARAAFIATLRAIRDLDNETLEAVGAMDNHEGYRTSDEDHRNWFTAMIDHMIKEAGDE